MKALIVGGDSKLGIALAEELHARGHVPLPTTRRDKESPWYLDLLNPVFPKKAHNFEVQTVYLVAAITGVMECETNPAAWAVNADAPVSLCQQAMVLNKHIVFVSSDAVEKAPRLAYSLQKSYAEIMVLCSGGFVLRPNRIPSDKMNKVAKVLVHAGEEVLRGMGRWYDK